MFSAYWAEEALYGVKPNSVKGRGYSTVCHAPGHRHGSQPHLLYRPSVCFGQYQCTILYFLMIKAHVVTTCPVSQSINQIQIYIAPYVENNYKRQFSCLNQFRVIGFCTEASLPIACLLHSVFAIIVIHVISSAITDVKPFFIDIDLTSLLVPTCS